MYTGSQIGQKSSNKTHNRQYLEKNHGRLTDLPTPYMHVTPSVVIVAQFQFSYCFWCVVKVLVKPS